MTANSNPNIGSSLDDFLEEEGIKEEAETAAKSRVEAEFEEVEIEDDELHRAPTPYEEEVELYNQAAAPAPTLKQLVEFQRRWNAQNDLQKIKAKKKRRKADKVAKASKKANRNKKKKR